MQITKSPMLIERPTMTENWDAELGGIRLLFGAGGLDRVGRAVGEVGARCALLVTDAGLVEAGHADRVRKRLEEESVQVTLFQDVGKNPTTKHVQLALDCAQGRSIDAIVGLGGGSAMDCAKAVNFLLTNGGRMEDYWGYGKARKPMLPSVGIPTTAGTGSDAQSYALISQEETRVKMACGDPKARFNTVILDPALMTSVPRAIAASSAIDAVTHVIESYVSTRRNPVSQMLAREAWQLIEPRFESSLEPGADNDVLGCLLLGAHLAGAAIEQSMLGAAHALANPLTAAHDVVHGAAVALMLPHVMGYNESAVGRLYSELHPAGSLAERVLGMRQAAGLPGDLRSLGIDRAVLAQRADEASRQWTAGFNPRSVAKKDLLELYEAAY